MNLEKHLRTTLAVGALVILLVPTNLFHNVYSKNYAEETGANVEGTAKANYHLLANDPVYMKIRGRSELV